MLDSETMKVQVWREDYLRLDKIENEQMPPNNVLIVPSIVIAEGNSVA